MAECFREPCVQNREIVVGLKTCHGDVLRNVLPPQDREGICSTFQVDLTTEFFFFLKNVSTSLNPSSPLTPPIKGLGFQGAHSEKHHSRVKPSSSFLFLLSFHQSRSHTL